jgi:hypothetical protein
MKIQEVFDNAENGTLTYEQFAEAAKANNANFVDLKEGGYVSVAKHNDELASKDKEIEMLNSTVSTRDTDLDGLKKQLEAAGADASKLEELTKNLNDLQAKYDGETKSYKEQLKKQAYEFAVKEFANSKTFSSAAAKRDFTQQMLAKGLKLEGDKIIGADDFVKLYSAENEDAFMHEEDYYDGGDDVDDSADENIPHFVNSTPGAPATSEPAGGFHFNFTGVRPVPTN